MRLTEADDDVPGVVGHAREEHEGAPDADDADEAEQGDADEERERDLERVVRLVQRTPVLVEHRADVDCKLTRVWFQFIFGAFAPSAAERVRMGKRRTVEPDHDQEDGRDYRGGDVTAVGLNRRGIAVRQGESRELSYDLLTVGPSRSCSRRSGPRARRL